MSCTNKTVDFTHFRGCSKPRITWFVCVCVWEEGGGVGGVGGGKRAAILCKFFVQFELKFIGLVQDGRVMGFLIHT